MHTYKLISIAMLALGSALPVVAGTLVETRGPEGEMSVHRIQGGKIRSDAGGPGNYLLLDESQKKAYFVNDEERSVMDMSDVMWAEDQPGSAGQQPQARLVKQGKGPSIAGYSTVHYKRMVGNTYCGDEFLASKTMRDAELRRFGEVMSKMGESMGGGMMGMQDPCDADDRSLYDTYLKQGMPMRSVDSDGTVTHEVTRIETNVSISASEYQLPEGYAVTSMAEMMRGAMSGMPATSGMPAAQQQPDTPEIDMSDMQKLREQAEEQMKRIMEQMEKQKSGN